MNDTEKAIDVLKRLRIATVADRVDGFRIFKPLSIAISALEEKSNGGWIPVSERLPKQGIPVLVSDKQGNVCVRAITCEIKGRKYWSQNKYDVLAWMPKPKSYEEN